ncbi:hypothetical protein DF163_21720 [Burkholderia stagnalis]|nr:hypothetical protein DF163_21720 [Burkholderia stagnalis]RQQ29499.1 hypothetical protein DF149_20100 [Burkholderia stagnalis]RQQ46535.1 hypothetical protein DF162_20825 [Burkholderia stagnalis]RQX96368.1 hypothetical protein DF119_21230 [Burkholderia stagnalis]RQY35311.1 hypothetical protein DF116_22425 [Burkholderia stagnalis]
MIRGRPSVRRRPCFRWRRRRHCLLLLVPANNLVMYWVVAFVRWPVEGTTTRTSSAAAAGNGPEKSGRSLRSNGW